MRTQIKLVLLAAVGAAGAVALLSGVAIGAAGQQAATGTAGRAVPRTAPTVNQTSPASGR